MPELLVCGNNLVVSRDLFLRHIQGIAFAASPRPLADAEVFLHLGVMHFRRPCWGFIFRAFSSEM